MIKLDREHVIRIARQNSLVKMSGAHNIIGCGRNKLYKTLRDYRVFKSNNMPKKPYIEKKIFVVREVGYKKGIQHHKGFEVLLTSNGLVWLYDQCKKIGLI